MKNSTSIVSSQAKPKTNEIDLNNLKKAQNDKDMIAYNNTYIDRNYIKVGKSASVAAIQPSPRLKQLVSPRLSQIESPHSTLLNNHKKYNSQTNESLTQKMLPNLRDSSVKRGDNNKQNDSIISNKNNKDFIQYKDKISRSTFISSHSKCDIIKPSLYYDQIPGDSQRNSLSTFQRLGEYLNDVEHLQLKGHKFENLNDKQYKQRVQNDNDAITSKQYQLEQNQKRTLQRHSLDERYVSQNNLNYLNTKKYKKLEVGGSSTLVDFQEYCKIKQQFHANQQINEKEIRVNDKARIHMSEFKSQNNMNDVNTFNMITNSENRTEKSGEKNVIKIGELNKRMEDTLQMQKQAKKVFESNSFTKVSQLLDLPYYKSKREVQSLQSQHNEINGQSNQQQGESQLIQQKKEYNSERKNFIMSQNVISNHTSYSPQQIRSKKFFNNNENTQINTNNIKITKSNAHFHSIYQQQPLSIDVNNDDDHTQTESIKLNQINQIENINQLIKSNQPQSNINTFHNKQRYSLNDLFTQNSYTNNSNSNKFQYSSPNHLQNVVLKPINQLVSPKSQILQLASSPQNSINNNSAYNNINTTSLKAYYDNQPLIKQQSEDVNKSNKPFSHETNYSTMHHTPYQVIPSHQQDKLFFQQNSSNLQQNEIQNQINNQNMFSYNKLSQFSDQQNKQNSNQPYLNKEENMKQNEDKMELNKDSQNIKDMLNSSQNNNILSKSQNKFLNNNFNSSGSLNKQKWKVNMSQNQIYKKQMPKGVNQVKKSTIQLQQQTSNELLKLNNQESSNLMDQNQLLNNSIENHMDQQEIQSADKKKSQINMNDQQSSDTPSYSNNSIEAVMSTNKIPKEGNQDYQIQIRGVNNPLQNKDKMTSNAELMKDPLFYDYSNAEIARSQKKRHTYDYSLQKQAIILSLGSQKLIKPVQNNNQNTSIESSQTPNESVKSNLQRKSSITSYFPSESKKEKGSLSYISNSIQNISLDESKSQSNISFSQIPRRQSVINILACDTNDISTRSVQSERKIQFQQQRDQQVEQIQQNRKLRQKRLSFQLATGGQENQRFNLEAIPMTLIQENEDEMCSPMHDLYAERKRTQTLFIPQLKLLERSIPSFSQLSPSTNNNNSPSQKKQLTQKLLKKYTNIIKTDLTNYLTFTLKFSDIKEKIQQCLNCCIELLENSISSILTSVDRDKFIQFNEHLLKQSGDFIRDYLFKCNFDLQQVLLFHKKYNFLVSLIYRKSLLEQIQNIIPLNDLIEETLSKLAETVTYLKKDFETEDMDNIKNGIIALLSDNKEVLLHYLDIYKKYIKIEPLDFFIIKQITFKSLSEKQFPLDIIFQVIEKIEKLRNYFFSHYQFSDSNFRKNMASLFLYNKVIVGYFLDPSVQNIQQFIHSLWNCLHGFDSLDKFGEELKKCLKTQPNNKFLELLLDFILENISKSLSIQEIDDIQLKLIMNAQQLIPTITQIDSEIIMEAIKEITLMRAINKQTPVGISETKAFDFQYIQLFFDFAVKTNREVISVFETSLIISPFKTNFETVNYQFEILKQAMNSLNIEQQLIDDISYLYQLILVKQLIQQEQQQPDQ